MKVVLLRVGIDTGSGGIHGPPFKDGTFEYIPIPDICGVDDRTYATMTGDSGRRLIEFFPAGRRLSMGDKPVHVDPEFATFTYGDPTRPKASLRNLERGDLLVFYCGLEGCDYEKEAGLYIIGYFEVMAAGKATNFSDSELREIFSENFHVRHEGVLRAQRERLVLVKGSGGSRLLRRARKISEIGRNQSGKKWKVLSREMLEIFGDFGGINSIQRSTPRWVKDLFAERAADFVRRLP